MKSLTLELVRIALRYLGMFLVTKGYFAPEVGAQMFEDPAVVQIVAGAVASIVAEVGYAVAKMRAAK